MARFRFLCVFACRFAALGKRTSVTPSSLPLTAGTTHRRVDLILPRVVAAGLVDAPAAARDPSESGRLSPGGWASGIGLPATAAGAHGWRPQAINRRMKSMLNKLTVEKFDTLYQKLLGRRDPHRTGDPSARLARAPGVSLNGRGGTRRIPMAQIGTKTELLRAPLKTERRRQQSAFVFIKPHADTELVRDFVRQHLSAAGVTIIDSGRLSGPAIDAEKLIDRHYHSIASKATLQQPAELNVPTAAFYAAYGEEWAAVLADGRAFNALGACAHLGISGAELNARWEAAMEAGERHKFGGGFYCARLARDSQQPIYVFNGFFAALRDTYTAPAASITWFVVTFNSAHLPWKRFRSDVIGPTDPMQPGTPATSLRAVLAAQWAALGLSAPFDRQDNGVHASASPLEAYAERANFLGFQSAKDDIGGFGQELLRMVLSEDRIRMLTQDPLVKIPPSLHDYRTNTLAMASLFDLAEDMDEEQCLLLCQEVMLMNETTFATKTVPALAL